MPPRDDAAPRPPASPAPRSGLAVMAIVIAAFAALSLFSNYQKWHIRDVEKVTIGPAPSPEPVPSRPSTESAP
ncbi:MAG: hypothetical protein M3032_12995 [Verrucomicrobiota bacterium]|nr:hypothetical protein [Verrucomicrobiota bacterium]